MKRRVLLTITSALSLIFAITATPLGAAAQAASPAAATTPPAAGVIPLGVTVIEMRAIVVGPSPR